MAPNHNNSPPPFDVNGEEFKRFLEQLDAPKEFVARLPDLCKTPYMCAPCGELARDALRLRFQFVKKFLSVAPSNAEEALHRFAAWALLRQQSGAMYVTLSMVADYCSKHQDDGLALDVEQMMDVMVPHPTRKVMYTSEAVHECEKIIMEWLMRAAPVVGETTAAAETTTIEGLDAAQSCAVRGILASGYSVLQGNAGCGKTRTIAALIDVLAAQGAQGAQKAQVVAAAFTHKAKNCLLDRLSKDATNKDTKDKDKKTEEQGGAVQVSTVHSLICRLKQQQQQKMRSVFLVLDEASMLDVDLLGELARAMLTGVERYQLCFVGDYFQIQPVGRGEVFRMLTEAASSKVHTLRKCYRTEYLDLEANYERVRAGKCPTCSAHFRVEEVRSEAAITTFLKQHIKEHLDGHKIICWQNHHIKAVNKWVQEARLAARAIGPQGYRSAFYVKDKVVFVGQNDDPAVTNATNGEVVGANVLDGVTVLWDTGVRRSYRKTADIQLSYAITAHKAQGSEYDRVLVACYDAPKMAHCLDKRWLYTCITRGRQSVTLLCTPQLRPFVEQPLRPVQACSMRFS